MKNGHRAAALIGLAFLSASVFASPSSSQERPTVAVVATGGTIAMKVDPVTHAPVPAVSGEDLIAAVPKLKEIANVRVVEFSNIPSDYMGPDRWPNLTKKVEEVLADPSVVGVVISHGTDTLDQTAYFLDLTLKSDKPVVAVGAQRNASDWDTDGPRNLLNAVRQVLAEDSKGKGVTVTLNSYINAARYVRKSHTSNVQTFTSGDAGALGYVDEDKVVTTIHRLVGSMSLCPSACRGSICLRCTPGRTAAMSGTPPIPGPRPSWSRLTAGAT